MAKKITEDGEILDEINDTIIGRVPPFFKTPWNHDTDDESRKAALTCKDPTKTQQQFAHEADINNILAKFMQTGELNLIGSPVYQQVAEEFDLQQTIVTQWQVETAWNALSPEVRNTLRDPQTFADYVQHCIDQGDPEPLIALGLAKRQAPTAAEPGTPTPDPQSATKAPTAPIT